MSSLKTLSRYALALLLTASLAILAACSGSRTAASSATITEKSLLWQVTHPDLQTTSYLYGTMHIVCTDNWNVPQRAIDALQQTESLVLELDLSDPQVMMQVVQAAMLPNGETVYDYMDDEQDETVKSFFEEYVDNPLMAAGLPRMKPIMITASAFEFLNPCENSTSVEQIFQQNKPEGAREKGLETVGDQLNALNSFTLEEQVEMLVQLASDPDSMMTAITRMNTLYTTEDLPGLYSFMAESEMDPTQSGALLDERNERWIPQLQAMFREGPVFVAVGAAHLPGKKGVINLLRKQGYTVTAIMPQ